MTDLKELKIRLLKFENCFVAVGEPPQCMSCVIPIAIRNALNSARAECGNTDTWYRMGEL